MAFNKLNVVIGANVEALQKELRKVERDLARFGAKMQRIGTDLTQLVSVPIAGLGVAALKSFSDIERLEKGLIALMGSGEAAAAEMEKLREVAKLPGLGFQEAIDGSLRLQAVGFSADKARETLLAFGKAVAVSGGTREDFQEVIYQLTQMTSKGKILAEDFKVLQSRIPILGQLLEDAFGTRSIEAIRDSGVTAADFTEAIIKAANESKTLQNVTGGLGNAFENFKDSAKIALATLGEEIARILDVEGFLKRLAESLEDAIGFFNGLSDSSKRFIVIAAGIAAAVGPVVLIIGKMTSLFNLAVIGFSSFIGAGKNLIAFLALLPIRISAATSAFIAFTASLTALQAVLLGAGIGIALLAIASAFSAIKKSATEAGAAQKAVADVQSQAIQQTAQEVGEVKRLVGVINDENTSKEKRIAAFNRLKAISPEYFGALDLEKLKTGELITISEKYTQSLINRAKAQLAANKIAEIDAKLADSQALAEESQLTFFQKARAALAGIGNAGNVAANATAQFSSNLKGNVDDLKKQRAELEKVLKAAAGGDLVNLGGGIPRNRPVGGGGAKPVTKTPEIATEQASVALVEQIDLLPRYTALANTAALSVQSLSDSSLNLKLNQESLNIGMQNTFPSIEAFKSQVESLGLAFDAIGERAIPNVTGAIVEGISAFGQYAKDGISNMKSLGKAVLAAGAVIIKSLIQQGVAAAISNALKNPAGIIPPVGLALASAAGLAASGLFSSLIKKIGIPALASGGIASSATLALVGEYPGARTNPEVIAPLDKLKNLIPVGGEGGFIAETYLAGSDLRILVRRADSRFARQTTG